MCWLALARGGAASNARSDATILLAPTAAQQFEATDCDGSPEGPGWQNKTQTTSSRGRRLAGLIKRGALDQTQIYSAPFHRHNPKWDALFLAATAGLIAADKHVTGATLHDNLSVSQHISDAGLYSTVATTEICSYLAY
jgi:hypothetical protein